MATRKTSKKTSTTTASKTTTKAAEPVEAKPAVLAAIVLTGDKELDKLAGLVRGLPEVFTASMKIKMGESFADQLGIDDQKRELLLLGIGR